ncbi:hypothetical protein [Streptomyces tsukubensis]|uniref:ESX-1 secretion-associated protein n=1 Tax=Streptomyces tsukubensis TaxID=83656 RepID=A0A1V4ABL8_9ACTN|nr:hypothetical protein [Streptomyces tsukubensis]OON80804.1 hypothetical protein B1H18_10425 [Streptomyces tsukubensis]
MADRNRADLDMINSCSDSLFDMRNAFKEHGNPADGYEDALGSDKLRDIFTDFSDTWKKTRKDLVKDIENLAKFLEIAAKSYDKLDHELAEALRNAKKSGKRGKQ